MRFGGLSVYCEVGYLVRVLYAFGISVVLLL